jgi:ATP phosphoribosyltransferase
MSSKEMALSAETILLTQRNLQPSLDWLRSIGLDAPDFSPKCYARRANGVTYGIASNSDIAPEVEEGAADFALLGSDKFGELPLDTGLAFEPLSDLACRFALLASESTIWPVDTALTVATSYPNAFASFATEVGITAAAIRRVRGKAERFPASGLSDAAFDIVETGASLRANNLKIVEMGGRLQLGGTWKT